MKDEVEKPLFSFESFLYLMSLFYGGTMKLRGNLYKRGIIKSKKLPCKVISIGNITVGGTGKTPMTIHVANMVKGLGYKVAIISRGYKGGAEKAGGIVSNGLTIFMGPDMAGDEPFMMATKLNNIPVVVGKNRFNTGMMALKEFKPDVLVLDDAFQHLKLFRDIDLVLLDNSIPFGNTHIFPRGTLREPVPSLSRCDALIMTRYDPASCSMTAKPLQRHSRFTRGKPVFKSFHLPHVSKVVKGETIPCDPLVLNGLNVYAFSGIANNNDFLLTIKDFKCYVTGFKGFPDHHHYSEKDFDIIFHLAQDSGADCLVTTEKDYVRAGHRIKWPLDLAVIDINVSLGEDEGAFNAFIKNRLLYHV